MFSFKGCLEFNHLDSSQTKDSSPGIGFDFSYSSSPNFSFEIHLFSTFNNITSLSTLGVKSLKNTGVNSTDFRSKDFLDYVLECSKVPTIVIWYNHDENTIAISRDPFGQIPVYYVYRKDYGVTFSSSVNSIHDYCKNDSDVFQINARKISEYFSLSAIGHPYSSDTFFKNVDAVLPGHIVQFCKNEHQLYSYINYDPEKFNNLTSLSQYGEVFRKLFLKSVERLIIGKQTLGMHLSGGLDSSSVVVAAETIAPLSPKHTFFFDIPSSTTGEVLYAKEVAEKINSSHHIVAPDYQLIDWLYDLTRQKGLPWYMFGATGLTPLSLQAAKAFHCDVFLTGHDGDSIVGNGKAYISKLIQTKKWAELEFELKAYSRTEAFKSGNPLLKDSDPTTCSKYLLKRLLLNEFKTALRSGSITHAIKTLYLNYSIHRFSPFFFVREAIRSIFDRQVTNRKVPQSILKNKFKSSTFSFDRPASKSFKDTLTGSNLKYQTDILYNQKVFITEDYFALSNQYNLQIVHPFFDKDLYELCLSVPDKLRFNNGYTRGTIREAMKGLLPESVRCRTTKAGFTDYAIEASLVLHQQGHEFLLDSAPIWDIVDKTKYDRFVGLLQNEDYKSSHFTIKFFVFRTICLAVWLHIYKIERFIEPTYQNTLKFDSKTL